MRFNFRTLRDLNSHPVNQVALLIDPLQFPQNLFDKALTWAQLHDASFRVIVIAEERFSVGAVSLNDDTQQERTLQPVEVAGHRINVILNHVKYMRKLVTAAGLHFTSTILVQPRIKDVLEETKHALMIFHELRDRQAASFDWEAFFLHVPMHKQVIFNKAHE